MFSRAAKDIVQHDFGEPTGLCVLLTGVIGTNNQSSILKDDHRIVTKCGQWRRILPSKFLPGCKVRLERDSSQQDDDTNTGKFSQLIEKVWLAVPELRRQRLVIRRCAMNCSRHIAVNQAKAVVGINGQRLI